MTKAAALLLAGSLALAACASDEEAGGGTAGEGGGDSGELKIGLAYDTGGRGDRSFNDSAYAGVEALAEIWLRPGRASATAETTSPSPTLATTATIVSPARHAPMDTSSKRRCILCDRDDAMSTERLSSELKISRDRRAEWMRRCVDGRAPRRT